MERRLQRLSWTKIKKAVPEKVDTILFPVGTIEAHGAAAIGTDNFIPKAIADLQAERLGALIAPTLNYGITKSLYRYPGSITVRPDNYTPFVADILNSFVDQKFKFIIVLNGHGGNNAALKKAAYDIHYHRKAFIAVVHWWQLVGDLTREHFGEAGGHAGLDETACVQAIDPGLVDAGEYNRDMAYQVNFGADVYPSPGSILLYEDGEGYPNFDQQQAKAYLPKMAAKVGDFIEDIIGRWKAIGI